MSPAGVWTIVALVGSVAALYGLVDALLDMRALRGQPNGRWLLARSAMRSQLLRLATLVLMAYVGLAVLFEGTFTSSWSPIIVALVLSATLMSANAVWDSYDRHVIRRALR